MVASWADLEAIGDPVQRAIAAQQAMDSARSMMARAKLIRDVAIRQAGLGPTPLARMLGTSPQMVKAVRAAVSSSAPS